jgi:predicted dehydrogenase
MKSNSTRRQFLGTALLAAGSGPLILSRGARAVTADQRIGLGIIGYGIRSRNLLGQYLESDELQVVGVAEPVEERCAIAARRINDHYGHSSATMHGDFRELIERDDVDAVMIGTPDHWHAIPAIMACRTGKHVYCEKPLSLTISEGRAIANAARISAVAFQTGSQQRPWKRFTTVESAR